VSSGGGQTVGRLWARYKEARARLAATGGTGVAGRQASRQASILRDRLVVNYSPLVKYVASRIGSRMTGRVEQEDMISWGVMGLLDAIETYDPDKKAKFETYAISKIRWAILDQLRKEDWVPRRVRARAQEIEAAASRLTQELRRPPTHEQIAARVGLEVGEYHKFLDQYARAQVASLEVRMETEGGPSSLEYGSLVVDASAANPQTSASREELREKLVEAIGDLGEQERLVATFYFYDGLTLREIGEAISLTEGRVSQILHQALGKLRGRLQGSPSILSGGWQEYFSG
jgi:RNA polymerase sigma factor for flagellar operon FliA